MPGRCGVKTTTESRVDIRRMKRAPTHPGEMLLEEFLKPLGLSQAEAARSMEISLNRLNLQMTYDLWHAYQLERRRGAA
jgi:antitoxin HigA-1